jgi:hypothetical protein
VSNSIVDAILRAIREAGGTVLSVEEDAGPLDDAGKYDPAKVLDTFQAHYQRQMDRGAVDIEHLDTAADILAAAADLAFCGIRKAGRVATDSFVDDEGPTESVAMDGTFAAIVRLGYGKDADPATMTDDERASLYLEGAQILRDMMGRLELPAGSVN